MSNTFTPGDCIEAVKLNVTKLRDDHACDASLGVIKEYIEDKDLFSIRFKRSVYNHVARDILAKASALRRIVVPMTDAVDIVRHELILLCTSVDDQGVEVTLTFL